MHVCEVPSIFEHIVWDFVIAAIMLGFDFLGEKCKFRFASGNSNVFGVLST